MAEIAEWVKFITDSEKEDGNSVVAEHVKAGQGHRQFTDWAEEAA